MSDNEEQEVKMDAEETEGGDTAENGDAENGEAAADQDEPMKEEDGEKEDEEEKKRKEEEERKKKEEEELDDGGAASDLEFSIDDERTGAEGKVHDEIMSYLYYAIFGSQKNP